MEAAKLTRDPDRKKRKAVELIRDPDETKDMKTLIAEVIPNPERWMDTPHPLLGGNKPKDLIGTELEEHLRDLVRSIALGIPS